MFGRLAIYLLMIANHTHRNRGFTLIELMVAISIFIIVALVTTGAIFTVNRLNQRAQAVKLVMDNLHFALDSLVFKMKQGYAFHCLTTTPAGGVEQSTANGCFANGGEAITFKTPKQSNAEPGQTAVSYTYGLVDDNGKKRIGVAESNGNFTFITMPELNIETLRFKVLVDPAVNPRPLATIVVAGRVQVGRESVPFALQTSVTER